MAECVQDDVLVFEDYTEYNIAYPVIVTRWEIKKVSGFNKRYLQVYFQKLDNNVKAFQLNITSFSVFGKEVESISERTIERVDEKGIEFSEMIPISNEAERVTLSVCQCLLLDGTAIKESTKRMVVNQFKPFEDEEDRAAAQRLLSTAKGYPIDNGKQHWFCACGKLNISESEKCITCNAVKSEVLQRITQENLQAEKEKIKVESAEQAVKKRKRIKLFSIIGSAVAAVCILIGILVGTLTPFKTITVDGLKFYQYDDGTYLVDRYNYNDATDTEIEIPSKIRGRAVTRIADIAFSNCEFLKSIVIPDSVTYIGTNAFRGCISLASIAIPDSVTGIGSSAFSGCSSLTSIVIPDRVTGIGSSAFSGCTSLTNIVIHDNVTSIGSSAFSGCTSLTNIVIHDNVTSIGSSAFSGCTSLADISIPESVTSVGAPAFSDCSSLTSLSISNSEIKIGIYAFKNCPIEQATIPGQIGTSIKNTKLKVLKIIGNGSIAELAFKNCSSLASVTISDGITEIGEKAFSGCTGLTKIMLPKSLNSISYDAFENCSSLKTIDIPQGTKRIGVSAFYGCTALESVTIPDSVTSIGSYAFWGCNNLKYQKYDNALYLGNSGNPYFALIKAEHETITACSISNNAKIIAGGAFRDCTTLTSVTIPQGLLYIDLGAFENCRSLKRLLYLKALFL